MELLNLAGTFLNQYGVAPALLLLIALVAVLLRKIDTNSASDAARAATFSKALEEHKVDTAKKFADQAEKLASVERDYLPRESHYRDIGGWRTEMNQLRTDLAQEIRGVREEMSTTNSNLLKTVLASGDKKNGS